MKILVTGGRGQLGCSFQSIAAHYPTHKFLFTDMPELDITDSTAVRAILHNEQISAIINCAAYTAVDRAENEATLAEKINVVGVRTLAELTREFGIKLIHISTDYVFDGESCHPLHESDHTAPIGVYGQTKLHGEQAIAASHCNAAIIRTSWLYSEFGANFVKTMLRVGAERDSLNIVYDQIGTPTYAPDLARAVMQVLDHGIESLQIYHFSNSGVTSWYDFAKEIFALSGITTCVNAIESSQYPTPAHRPSYSVLSKEKIKSIGAIVPYWRDSLCVCMDILLKK